MKLRTFALFILLTILLVTTGCDEKATSAPTAVVGPSPTTTSVLPTATTAYSEKVTSTPTAVVGPSPTATSVLPTATTAYSEKATPTPTAIAGKKPTLTARLDQVTLPTLDSATIQLAGEGVSANAEWTPVMQELDGVEMVLVPAGCFMMGSTEEEEFHVQALC